MNNFNKWSDKKAKSVYKCPYCKKYHFTTQNRADSKRDHKWHITQVAEEKEAPVFHVRKRKKTKWVNFGKIQTQIHNTMVRYYKAIKKTENK